MTSSSFYQDIFATPSSSSSNYEAAIAAVIARLPLNAAAFVGVDRSGATDSTAGLLSAIQATPAGGSLYIPSGTYKVSGTGTEVFLITKSINVVGDGAGYSTSTVGFVGTTFTGALPTNCALFRVKPAVGEVLRGTRFTAFNIGCTSGASWFVFDTTASTTSELAEVELSRIRAPIAPTNDAVLFLNRSDNLNGGTFNAIIQDQCYFACAGTAACVNIVYGGDTIRIYDSILTGTGYAVYCAQIMTGTVDGGGQLIVRGCNVTAYGGIQITAGVRFIIEGNEIECAGPALAGNMIGIAGSSTAVQGGTIVHNQLQTTGSASAVGELIYIGNAVDVVIDNNRLTSGYAGIGAGILVNTMAVGTRIGSNNKIRADFTTSITDLGIKTECALPLPFTPTFTGTGTAGTGQAYTWNKGSYTNNGGMIRGEFLIIANAAGGGLGTAAGNLQIGGLPLPGMASHTGCVQIAQYTTASSMAAGLTGVIPEGTTTVALLQNTGTAPTNLTVTQAGNSVMILGSFAYRAY